MFNLKIETFEKNIVELSHNESDYQIINVIGLNPPNAQINNSPVAKMDGALFNSSKLDIRNIVITVKINGNVEKNRLFLYRCFRTKEYCKIFYENNSRNVFIEGFVETFECNLFSKSEIAQISIVCLNPYFKDLKMITDDISKIVKHFQFPFSINIDNSIPFSTLEINKVTNVINSSESETGLIINAMFLGDIDSFEIRNIKTGEKMLLTYSFVKNDTLIINCNRGSKSIILLRDGVEINMFPFLVRGSIFFQLGIGDNYFSYLADEGNNDQLVSILFKHYNTYRGV